MSRKLIPFLGKFSQILVHAIIYFTLQSFQIISKNLQQYQAMKIIKLLCLLSKLQEFNNNMYATWLEEMRFNLQSVEIVEKAMVSQMLALQDNPKDRSIAQHRMNNFATIIQQKSKFVLNFLKQQTAMKKQQLSIIEGQKSIKPTNDKKKSSDVIWQNFYDKVKQIKDQYKKQEPSNYPQPKNTVQYFRKIVFMPPFKQPDFSLQENKGKYVDLHTIYLEYLNLCKVMEDSKQATRLHDYLWFLQNLDKFDDFPINKKFKNHHKYLNYLQKLSIYLDSFLKRSRPLYDVQQFQKNCKKVFISKYQQGRIPGWEKDQDIDQTKMEYCSQCNKLFITNQAFVSHLMGKKHKTAQKNYDKLADHSQDEQNARQQYRKDHQNKKIQTAEKQFKIIKLREELANVIYDTMNLVRKKQTRGYEQIQDNISEQSQSEQADAPIYNPKNLPLGWDGKPIPYWLYKLHGLGIQYKCQICGNYSYWGRKAFEMHFQQWRHNYGMKCLKIPNTVHFKDITTINDALTLHQKLMRQSQQSQFRPDLQEEFQDNQGNILNKKTYFDMKKQGLIE